MYASYYDTVLAVNASCPCRRGTVSAGFASVLPDVFLMTLLRSGQRAVSYRSSYFFIFFFSMRFSKRYRSKY